jgi:hypothetical protein
MRATSSILKLTKEVLDGMRRRMKTNASVSRKLLATLYR